MKRLVDISIAVVSTIFTMFLVLYLVEIPYFHNNLNGNNEFVPVMNVYDSPQEGMVEPVFTLFDYDEIRINAIEKVAEAVVGILSISDGFGGSTGEAMGPYGGSGSGVVFKVENGSTYIVTNDHVIDRAIIIEVIFNDEQTTRKEAVLVGTDVFTDIAVLRIDDFEAEVVASFGKTEDLRLGQTVIAIGNPLGFDFAGSTTVGHVSGHNRSVSIPILCTDGYIQKWAMTVLQTDTAINPGNSGGALINLNSEVIGINSMKIAQSGIEGMSFSIPTYIVIPVIEDILENGKVIRARIGVSMVNVNLLPRPLKESINLPPEINSGVLINSIKEDELASSLQLIPNDVITHIGDVRITDIVSFRQTLFSYKNGEEITFTIIRDGREFDIHSKILLSDFN